MRGRLLVEGSGRDFFSPFGAAGWPDRVVFFSPPRPNGSENLKRDPPPLRLALPCF